MKDTSMTAQVAVSQQNISSVSDSLIAYGLATNRYRSMVVLVGDPEARFMEHGGKDAIRAFRVVEASDATPEETATIGLLSGYLFYCVREGHEIEDTVTLNNDVDERFEDDAELPALTMYLPTETLNIKGIRYVVETVAIDPNDAAGIVGRTRNAALLPYYHRPDVIREIGSLLTRAKLDDPLSVDRNTTYDEEQIIRSLRNGFVVPICEDEDGYIRLCLSEPKEWSVACFSKCQQDSHESRIAFFESLRDFVNDPATWEALRKPPTDAMAIAKALEAEGITVRFDGDYEEGGTAQ